MTQDFKNITTSDRIDTGLLDLLDRDLTAITAMSGESDPENPPQDSLCDNRTLGVIKLNGNVLIDYKNQLLNTTTLSSKLQPLNSILTAMSENTLIFPSIISTSGDVYPISSYGINATNAQSIDGAKALSKKSIIRTIDINNASITQEKFETPLSEEAQFKCGTLLYSCKTGERSGFLVLGTGYTLGGSTSNGTYRNPKYYDLYEQLWQKTGAVIRDYSGNIVGKGENALSDFDSGKTVDLPSVRQAPNSVIFTHESESAAQSLEVTLENTGDYEFFCVGSYGGLVLNQMKWSKQAFDISGRNAHYTYTSAAGGSGALARGVFSFRKPYQTVQVNLGKNAKDKYESQEKTGSDGLDHYLYGEDGDNTEIIYEETTIVSAGGGSGGDTSVWRNNVRATPVGGTGGTAYVHPSAIDYTLINGNDGSTAHGDHYAGIYVNGGASVITDDMFLDKYYGRPTSNVSNGTKYNRSWSTISTAVPAYVKITYLGTPSYLRNPAITVYIKY